MKIKGNVRPIDELGRVVIPIDFRKSLNITSSDLLDISMDNGCVIIRKLNEHCALCGEDEFLTHFKGKAVCSGCLREITETYKR